MRSNSKKIKGQIEKRLEMFPDKLYILEVIRIIILEIKSSKDAVFPIKRLGIRK